MYRLTIRIHSLQMAKGLAREHAAMAKLRQQGIVRDKFRARGNSRYHTGLNPRTHTQQIWRWYGATRI